jgi:predicted SAM-dependent methyltransferase
MTYLELGSGGEKPQHSAITEFESVNIITLDYYSPAEVKHNMCKFPYPFKDKQFDGVLLSHVYEHFTAYEGIRILEECHRILKPNGRIVIYCPHFACTIAQTHLTHQRLVGWNTFDTLCENTASTEKYTKKRFVLENKQIGFGAFWRKFKIFGWLANDFPGLYENHLRKFLPSPSEIRFEIVVKK